MHHNCVTSNPPEIYFSACSTLVLSPTRFTLVISNFHHFPQANLYPFPPFQQITMSPPEKMEAIRLKFPQLAPCGRDYHLATKYSFSLLSNRTKLDGIGPSRMQTTFPDSHAGRCGQGSDFWPVEVLRRTLRKTP